VEVGLIAHLGARLVGKGGEEASQFRVAEVKEAARHTGNLVVARIR